MTNGKTRVLIVEDDEMISHMYKTKLEGDGYEVATAGNGGDGLRMAFETRPDVVLLDVIMPQLDGFAILGELKKNEKTKGIKVIMLTNLGTDEDVAKANQLGADGYIVKAELTPAQVSEEIKKRLS